MPTQPRTKRSKVSDVLATYDEAAIIQRACMILDARLQRGEVIADPAAAGLFCKLKLQDKPYEVFACLFLNSRHEMIAWKELFRGTIDGAEVHPREIAREAIACNAAAVILAHNHPSGNPEPSAADRAVTARAKQTLALIDVRLLDHFVIGTGEPTSLAAKGWV